MAAVKDLLPNRAYVVVTLAAATTTAVFTTVQTMMGTQDMAGWLISRIDVSPRILLDGWQGASTGVRFQVAQGEQAALLPIDDKLVIGTLDVNTVFSTNGGARVGFPLTWVGPILVATRELTCLIDGSDDVAPLQSVAFVFTLWYQWVQMKDREWLEAAQQTGLL